jgi:DNA-binding NtrC family response regulator
MPRAAHKYTSDKSIKLLFLIVDDDTAIGECIGSAIKLSGHDSIYFKNPHEALEAFVKDQGMYHGIFTDLRMPHMNGERLIEEVRKMDTQIPIVIMTATTGIFTTNDLVRLNVPSLITKPFDLIELAVGQIEKRYLLAE